MKTLTLITLALLSSVTFAAVGESKKPPCENTTKVIDNQKDQ